MKLYRNKSWDDQEWTNKTINIIGYIVRLWAHIGTLQKIYYTMGAFRRKTVRQDGRIWTERLCDIWQNCATISTVAQVDKSLLYYCAMAEYYSIITIFYHRKIHVCLISLYSTLIQPKSIKMIMDVNAFIKKKMCVKNYCL